MVSRETLRKDAVIILGMGPSRMECPFDCAEVYACNTGYRQVYGEEWAVKQHGFITKLFIAHGQVMRPDGPVFNWEELNKVAAHEGIKVFNIHKVKGLNSRMYPLKRMSEKFETNYFSNTIAYMVAYAVDKSVEKKEGKYILKKDGFKTFYLYGVDMFEQGEYLLEKGGIEFWLAFAQALGIKIIKSPMSKLLTTHTGKPYGQKYFKLKSVDPFGLLKRKRSTEGWVELPPEELDKIIEATRARDEGSNPAGFGAE